MNVGHLVLEPQGFNNSRLGHPAPSRSCKIARKMAKINIGSLFWLLLNDIVFFLFEKGGGGVGGGEFCNLFTAKRSRLTYYYFHLYTVFLYFILLLKQQFRFFLENLIGP